MVVLGIVDFRFVHSEIVERGENTGFKKFNTATKSYKKCSATLFYFSFQVSLKNLLTALCNEIWIKLEVVFFVG